MSGETSGAITVPAMQVRAGDVVIDGAPAGLVAAVAAFSPQAVAITYADGDDHVIAKGARVAVLRE